MNLGISILVRVPVITEDAQQVLEQVTEIENVSKRNITPILPLVKYQIASQLS